MSLMGVPPGRSPQRFERRLIDLLAIGALAAVLAACTSDVSLDDFNLSRKINNVKDAASSTLSFGGGRDFSVRPVTQADLVGPQGQCADAGPGPGPTGEDGQPNAATIVQSGIALQMTECEVVQRAGGPDGIEFGSNPGERNVVLTYTHGGRPGIYRFAGGRLYSIEGVAEPQAPARPQKKSAPAKKRPPA
jgi:hypothetical protein